MGTQNLLYAVDESHLYNRASNPYPPTKKRKKEDEKLDGVIERVAARQGALVLDLRGFGARNHVMTDHVHPTAFGQIAIAERALDVLARDGMQVAIRPSRLIAYTPSRRQRLRGDLTYAYRHVKVSLRAGAIRLRFALFPPPGPPPR